MKERRSWWRVRRAVVAIVVAAGAAVASASPAMADAAGKGGDYIPLPNGETRVLSTPSGIGAAAGIRGPASTTTFQVLGVGGIPASGVQSVLVDVTIQAPTAGTYLTLWPGDGTARPGTSTMHAAPNDLISNSAVVQVGTNGKLSLYNNAGNTHMYVDVQGYFTTLTGASGPGGFVPVPTHPTVLSTSGGIGVPAGTIPGNGSRTVNLLGSGIVPAGSPAVFVDLQVSGATKAGWVKTSPTGGSGFSSSLQFSPGMTSSGTVIRIAADGRATITNTSTEAITMLIRLQGYFTASNTQGAGLRPLVKRLIDTNLPANGSIDVAVGGTNGLPIKGVAGAALNFIAGSGTATGYFKAWPLNGTEPASSVSTWVSGRARSGMAVIQPGFEGKIRVKSVSGGTVRLTIDMQGWFADPLPNLPPAQYTPTSVLQAPPNGTALGSIEYAYVDNIGRTRMGHQTAVGDFNSVQWTTSGGNDAFTGQPGISAYPDGRVQLTVQNTDGDYWAASQTAYNSATFNPWADLGGSMASTPTQVTLSTGVTLNFGVDDDGKLWHHRIVTGTTSYWRSLGDQDLVGPVTAVPVQQGVQIFARDTAGAVRTALYANDGSMSAWTNLGGAGIVDRPAAIVYPGYRLRVFVRGGDGTVQTKLQDISGAWPADWEPVGAFAAAGAPAAILDPVLGRVTVVARGTDNEVYRVFETAQGTGVWGDWLRVNPDLPDPAASDPTLAPIAGATGQTWVIVYRNVNDATRVYERQTLTGLRAKASKAAAEFSGHTLPAPPDVN